VIKVSNREILQMIQSLNDLNNLKLPIKVSFKIAKITKKLQEVVDIYEESRKKIIEEYCEKDEEGNVITQEDGTATTPEPEKLNKAMEELLVITSKIDAEQLELEDLGKIQIEPRVLVNLSCMIKD